MTSRHFVGLQVETERELYEVMLGTMKPSLVSLDSTTLEFVGRILDIVFLSFEEFNRAQLSSWNKHHEWEDKERLPKGQHIRDRASCEKIDEACFSDERFRLDLRTF